MSIERDYARLIGVDKEMRMKFIIKVFKGENLFIGAGLIFGDRYIGLAISNLFIGLEREIR